MAIANTLQNFMLTAGVHYDVLPHPRTLSSNRTAQAAHVSGDRMAKAVLLEDDQGYVLAVLPASHRLALGEVHHAMQRILGLATEGEIAELFRDCDIGAIPPFGAPYGIETILDDSLMEQPQIYFEAGDHEDLIRVSGKEFQSLLRNARHGHFSHHL